MKVKSPALRGLRLCYNSSMVRFLTWVVGLVLMASLPAESFAAKKRARGKLKIESTVDGAKVELNGLKAGKTPLKAMRLKAGPYTLRISKIGHLDFETKVVVKAGRLEKVWADLLPVAGILNIKTRPKGAQIFIDGKLVGKTPAILEMKLGKRSLEIRADGYLSLRQELQSIPGELVQVAGQLELGDDDPLAGDLALVPLEKKPDDDPLADDLALVPLAKPDKTNEVVDDPLALEPLLPLSPLAAPEKNSGLSPMDVTTKIADRTQWYENWWLWGSAGAVLVSSAVVTAVVLSGGSSGESVDSFFDLAESTPTEW